jgi:hypothetical protein
MHKQYTLTVEMATRQLNLIAAFVAQTELELGDGEDPDATGSEGTGPFSLSERAPEAWALLEATIAAIAHPAQQLSALLTNKIAAAYSLAGDPSINQGRAPDRRDGTRQEAPGRGGAASGDEPHQAHQVDVFLWTGYLHDPRRRPARPGREQHTGPGHGPAWQRGLPRRIARRLPRRIQQWPGTTYRPSSGNIRYLGRRWSLQRAGRRRLPRRAR